MPGDIAGLKPGRQRYTLLTNEAGGIMDDLMVANLGADKLFLVVNASRKEDDFTHLAANLPAGVQLEPHEDRALLALQGPAAAAVIGTARARGGGAAVHGRRRRRRRGHPCLVSRSGYTGEDGFEISVPAERAEALADRLVAEPEVAPAGLGARDTLRLEAGLCLYGNDIDELTTPVEAGLTWVIAKRRARELGFSGRGRDPRPVGARRARGSRRHPPDGRAPARAQTDIVAGDGTAAGIITSGSFSPSLNAPIAMGYVRKRPRGRWHRLP